jgi:hypothetical protein
VISTPVVEDRAPSADSADPESRDSGALDADDGRDPDGDFWYVGTVSGGDAARPSEYFDGDEVSIEAGSVRLIEGATDFRIELRYAGTVDTVPYQATCWVPIEVTGGLPATAADDSSGDGAVGCASVEVATTQYAVEPDGMTVIETNDGRAVSGTFTLIAQASSGGILQANGRIHAVLCAAFWSGVPCTY